jgi:ABC-type Fe3+/spermidine/putrescine transport system ATPase subunit
LARALVVEPDVLLLDEPLSNLDLKLRQAMRIELKSIQKRTGVTMIYVTHDQGEALTMSDNVAVMERGKLMQIGSPTEVYERPANEFVAKFLGDANILSGTVRSVADNLVQVSLNNGLIVSSSVAVTVRAGMPVKVSVRPERIRISASPPQMRNSFKGRIEERIYVGSDVRYHILVGDQRLVVEDKVRGLATLHSTGEHVFVGWDESNSVILTVNEEG